eukprot:TRINITY_DN25623_c0_g2_i1.p1 TRINITY_DN25623_c0_g2~~TRINITY_DN25623_c0_g2_i1.p1  ORF type:complete len:1173 (+),score=200.15 TRINITY_DN25623_c0_g2_i1:169-3687(+)
MPTVEAMVPGGSGEGYFKQSEFQLGFACFPLLADRNSCNSANNGSPTNSVRPSSAKESVCRLVGQFKALRRLRHPRLCRLLELLVGRDHVIVLASEHYSVSLATALRQRSEGGGLGIVVATKVAKDICEGLTYLNAQGLVHGHLEAEAVLFAEGIGSSFKLTGHGLGHLVLHGRLVEFPVLPGDVYLAPELAALHTPSPPLIVAGGWSQQLGGGGSSGVPAGVYSSGTSKSAQITALACCSCKPDVWSLGVIVIEVLYGIWCSRNLEDQSTDASSFDTAATRALVVLETARALGRFTTTANAAAAAAAHGASGGDPSATATSEVDDDAELLSLSAPAALGAGDFPIPSLPGLPLDSSFPSAASESPLRRLEASYRSWLCGETAERDSFSAGPSSTESQDLRDFWAACLIVQPGGRPTAGDLLSHPALGSVTATAPTVGDGLRWSDCAALRSERLLFQKPAGVGSPLFDATPLQYFRSDGIDVEDIFYWWTLAGGDAFAELASRRIFRPVPPVFRLPLCTRDTGADDERGAVTPFFASTSEGWQAEGATTGEKASSGAGSPSRSSDVGSHTTTQAQAIAAAVAASCGHEGNDSQQFQETTASPCGLWGPTASLRPRTIGVGIRGLCNASKAVDRLGQAGAQSSRPALPSQKHHSFAYQWSRCRLFRRLLMSLPGSRQDVFREASEDIPPSLRSKIWAALLGADSDSDHGCWAAFYERLLASPVDLTGEEQRTAMQCPLNHELWSHPRGRLQVERLVHALLKANPSLTRMDGLGALAAPVAAIYPDNEPAAFMFLQRLLHGFLWHFYAEESPMKRRQCTHLFAALLRFADPQLELHLQMIGMHPETYASMWFPTWFAQLFPLSQLLLLWDLMLLRPPQFPLFVGVCLMHFFRKAFLGFEDVATASMFLNSCAPLVDVSVLAQSSLALFHGVPASVTLPLYPRHSAGDALLSGGGATNMVAIDPNWKEDSLHRLLQAEKASAMGGDHEDHEAAARELLGERAMDQWRQCEWWRRRAPSAPAPPVMTVDDLLSFRKRCFVLDVRSFEEFTEGHFQASTHVREAEEGELSEILPQEVLCSGGTPGLNFDLSVVGADTETAEVSHDADPWLFDFDPREMAIPELRMRLVVIIGGRDDYGATFAVRLLNAGIRHIVCLLGGAAILKAEAPSYMIAPGRE